jgi:hypothetical protein
LHLIGDTKIVKRVLITTKQLLYRGFPYIIERNDLMLKPKDLCPHCLKHKLEPIGQLMIIRENYPYNEDHLQCSECSSTYNLEFDLLWQDEINSIAGSICDKMKDELKDKHNIDLDVPKEDELFDLITDYLDQYGKGDYKNYN